MLLSDPDRDRLVVRPAEAADAPAWTSFLAREQARTYAGMVPDSFEADVLRGTDVLELAGAFAEPGEAVHVLAEVDEEIVGVAATEPGPASWEVRMGFVPAPAERELARLYIAPEWHGTGLAQRLFDEVVDDRAHYLWLINGNDRASRFYERAGFEHLDEEVLTGPRWGNIPMHRMVRPAR